MQYVSSSDKKLLGKLRDEHEIKDEELVGDNRLDTSVDTLRSRNEDNEPVDPNEDPTEDTKRHLKWYREQC